MHDSKTTPAVARTGRVSFGMVDPAVIRDPTLPANTKNVYAYLATYCSDNRSAFPSRATMAKQIGISVRTVDAALKAGSAAGLWTVAGQIREDGRQTSNLYLLHDFDGGYVVGSGSRGADSARGRAQDLQGDGADLAHELDNGSTQASTETISTSSDAACGPHEQAREAMNEPTLYLPEGFANMNDAAARRKLVACSIKALEASGRYPAANAAQRIGASLREHSRQGKSRDELVRMLRATLRNAEKSSLVVDAPQVPAPRDPSPTAGCDPDAFDYDEQLVEVIETSLDGPMQSYTRNMVDSLIAVGRHGDMIVNAAIEQDRNGPW